MVDGPSFLSSLGARRAPLPLDSFALLVAWSECRARSQAAGDLMSRHALGPWLLCTTGLVLGCSDEKESVTTAPVIDRAAVAASVLPGDPLPWVSPAERA